LNQVSTPYYLLHVDHLLARFGIAFLIGALVGMEREKANREDGQHKTTGLRTFILIALSGAIAAWLSLELNEALIFVGAALVCALFIITGYRAQLQAAPESVGLTTEFAAFIVFLLGGVTLFGFPELAVMLTIVTSAVLAYREAMHRVVEKMGRDDLFAGLKLLIVAFIILPVVPREPVDPWGALNPYEMTWLVILIAGLSLLGYVAARWLGPKRGTAITGIAGGMVSSTATTISMSRRSRDETAAGATATLAGGILLSWMVMFLRVVVTCLVVNAELGRRLALPLGLMALIAAVGAFVNHRAGSKLSPGAIKLKNPFSLSFAIKFALLLGVVALLVNRAQAMLSDGAVYAVAGLTGLTDVDAITLSMARHAANLRQAMVAITVAVLANTLTKMGIVWWMGSAGLPRHVLPTGIIILVGAAACVVLVAAR